MSYVTHTIMDRSGERSFARHHLPQVTAANYAAVTGNTPVTQHVGSLRVALANVCLGTFVRHEVTAVSARASFVPPDGPQTQRENKVLISCRSSAGRSYTIELPHVNRSLYGQAGTDQVNRAQTDWAGWETVLMASFVDGYGDTFTIEDARFVGRRL